MARMPNMDNSTASASWVDQSLTVRTKLSNKQDADTCSSLSDSSLLCTDIKRDLSFCHFNSYFIQGSEYVQLPGTDQ